MNYNDFGTHWIIAQKLDRPYATTGLAGPKLLRNDKKVITKTEVLKKYSFTGRPGKYLILPVLSQSFNKLSDIFGVMFTSFDSQYLMALILTSFGFFFFLLYGIGHLLHYLCTATDVCLTSPQPGKFNKLMWNLSKTVRTSIKRAHSRVCYSRTNYSILSKERRGFSPLSAQLPWTEVHKMLLDYDLHP